MALIDVSFLLTDPDFCDPATLYVRSSAVNQYGENELTEVGTQTTVVVQAPTPDTLAFLPESVKLSDSIDVWLSGSLGELHTQAVHGYSDVLLWKGKRYCAIAIAEDFMNYGAGYTHAIFALEGRHA